MSVLCKQSVERAAAVCRKTLESGYVLTFFYLKEHLIKQHYKILTTQYIHVNNKCLFWSVGTKCNQLFLISVK